jgi:hypothetical protein
MTNENCLSGIRCPACGQQDRFKITALITCMVTDDGSEPVGDHEWDGDSTTHCPECGFDGTLKAFQNPAGLPPHPNNLNDYRSARAASALAEFIRITGADEEDALGDLLTDLMHWCDRNDYDFELALLRACSHYEAETIGEGPT